MNTSREEYAVFHEAYTFGMLPISVVGFLSNPLVVVVWAREEYHPIRLIIMVLSVANNVFIVFYNLVHFYRQLGPVRFICYSTRFFAAQAGLFMTVVQYLRLFYSRRNPFDSKKRIVISLFFIFIWSLLLKKGYLIVKENQRSLMIFFNFFGVFMPSVLQLLVLLSIYCQYRVMYLTLGDALSFHLTHPTDSIAGEPPVSTSVSAHSAYCPSGSGQQTVQTEAYFSTAQLLSLRHSKEAAESIVNELRLIKAVLVMSVTPVFAYGVGFVGGGSYTALPPSDSARNKDFIYWAIMGVSQLLNYSYPPWMLLFLFPSFRTVLTSACSPCFRPVRQTDPRVAPQLTSRPEIL